MPLFNKKNKLNQESIKASKEVISSILSKDMQISGEIRFKGKARIDGLVEGNVKGEHLILSETSKILGDVDVDSLICHGTIEGNINSKLVTAHPTATIQGILAATNLTVESGATLNGEIKATQQQPQKSTKTTPSPLPTKEIQKAA